MRSSKSRTSSAIAGWASPSGRQPRDAVDGNRAGGRSRPSISLVVVFLPTAMMSGVPGLFFKQFGWTAVIAVLASLLVARLLTPMMAAYLAQAHAAREQPDGPVMRWYPRGGELVSWRTGAPPCWRATVFFIASLALVPLTPVRPRAGIGSRLHHRESRTASRKLAAKTRSRSRESRPSGSPAWPDTECVHDGRRFAGSRRRSAAGR